MKKIIRVALVILIVIFVAIQFIRPAKNAGEEVAAHQIAAVQSVPDNVQQTLRVSCYDCHSNTTVYPWYSKIQPVAWFLDDHIAEGKKELNFSVFASYPAYRRYKKFKEIGEEVKSGDMPMLSYTLLHRGASLSESQKLALINWAAGAMKDMEAKYPADSLARPK